MCNICRGEYYPNSAENVMFGRGELRGFFCPYLANICTLHGHGGIGVRSVPCNWRFAGSNLPQATA